MSMEDSQKAKRDVNGRRQVEVSANRNANLRLDGLVLLVESVN
jgi:hypothetical protein